MLAANQSQALCGPLTHTLPRLISLLLQFVDPAVAKLELQRQQQEARVGEDSDEGQEEPDGADKA